MLYLHNWTSRKKWLAHVISCHAQDYMTSRLHRYVQHTWPLISELYTPLLWA